MNDNLKSGQRVFKPARPGFEGRIQGLSGSDAVWVLWPDAMAPTWHKLSELEVKEFQSWDELEVERHVEKPFELPQAKKRRAA